MDKDNLYNFPNIFKYFSGQTLSFNLTADMNLFLEMLLLLLPPKQSSATRRRKGYCIKSKHLLSNLEFLLHSGLMEILQSNGEENLGQCSKLTVKCVQLSNG